MDIIVTIRQVPDLVEELEVDDSGKDLNREWLKYKISEFDDHALEEALLLKEAHGGTVTVMALDKGEDTDKALFTAAAKGADKLIKLTGSFDVNISSHEVAKTLANAIGRMNYHMIFTGVQSVEDRDGQVAVLLAHFLGVPHVSVVTGVTDEGNGKVSVKKEFGGGMVGEFEVTLPAVLGIQAAREAPRYVPVAKVRQAMKGTTIEEVAASGNVAPAGTTVLRMFMPESGKGAQMFSGSAAEVASQLAALIKTKM